MRFVDKTHLNTMQVCYLLGITPKTLNSWYKYINETPADQIPKDCPGLPPYKQKNKHTQKLWWGNDLHKLYAFQKWVPKGRGGLMGHINSKNWSKQYFKDTKGKYKN